MCDLFTFVLDYDGGTYISQFDAESIDDAIDQWIASVTHPDGLFAQDAKNLVADREDIREAVPLTGLQNVWCTSFLVKNELGLLNIVKTQPEERPR